MRTPHPEVVGTVKEWNDGQGWGVLLTPDGLRVWCHYSDVRVDGYRTLKPETRVAFDYETPGQDGYDGRVLTSARPVV